jgi:hypothetical protein
MATMATKYRTSSTRWPGSLATSARKSPDPKPAKKMSYRNFLISTSIAGRYRVSRPTLTRYPTNVCGQPNVLQIRSHVSHAGCRVPASSSR